MTVAAAREFVLDGGQRANEPQRREWWIPGLGSNGGCCHRACAVIRASSKHRQHQDDKSQQSPSTPELPLSLSLNPRLNQCMLDSFCRTMIKLSPWGGQFVSSWDLCSNFFRQVWLNWVSSPRALLVGFTPARSLEAKQTAVLAGSGFLQQHQNLARNHRSSSNSKAATSFSFSHKTTICKTFLFAIVLGGERRSCSKQDRCG